MQVIHIAKNIIYVITYDKYIGQFTSRFFDGELFFIVLVKNMAVEVFSDKLYYVTIKFISNASLPN